MKLVVLTDIHGSIKYAKLAVEKALSLNPNKIVILGDVLYHGPRNNLPEEYAPKEVYALLNNIKDKIIGIKGNCDAAVDEFVLEFPLMPSVEISDNGKHFLFTHGEQLESVDYDANIICGHFHVSKKENNIFYLGSVSMPKDNHHAYGVYENGKFTAYDLLTDEVIYEDVME